MATVSFEGWAVVELMGHRERPGRVSEVEMFGGKLLRIDIPGEDGAEITEFYSVASIYSLRPVSEDVARDRAKRMDIRPIRPVEYRQPSLPAPPAPDSMRARSSDDEELDDEELDDEEPF